MITQHNETTLSQFEQFLAQIALSPKTITNYLADLRFFARWAEAKYTARFSLLKVSPEQIRAYRQFLLSEQGRARSTVNRHLQALRKLCAYMFQANLAPTNAAEEITLITAEKQTAPLALESASINKLIEAAANTRSAIAKRDTAILHLLIYSGLRVSEIADLQIDDVQFDFPGIHLAVRDSRSQEIREIPLPSEGCSALKEWLVIRPQTSTYPNLFLSQEGRPVSPRTVQRIVSRCAKTANLKGVTAQLLRRTYAINLLNQTDDMQLVSQRLGHQSLKITQQYLKL